MPTHSERLIRFKDKLEAELRHVTREIDQLKAEIEALKAEIDHTRIGAPDREEAGRHLERMRELLVIQRDHKERLNAEFLRVGDRNPGLLRPDFE